MGKLFLCSLKTRKRSCQTSINPCSQVAKTVIGAECVHKNKGTCMMAIKNAK